MLRVEGKFVLCVLAAAAAVVPAAMAQTNIAFIDTQTAMAQTAEVGKWQAEMETRFQPRFDEIQKLQQDLQDVQNKLQTMEGKLTVDAQAELNTQGQRLQRDLERKNEDLQTDVDYERTEILQTVGQKMALVVEQLAESKGIDAVLDINAAPYYKPELDLTAEATAAYDQAHPVE